MKHEKPTIDKKHKINPGTINRISAFKEFVGEEAFNQILQGSAVVDIPFDEESYFKLLEIVLDEFPDAGLDSVTYADAEEIVSFFCQPFAGRLLKQAKSSLAGISSLLAGVNPELMKMGLELTSSPQPISLDTNASNSQTETLMKETESLENARSQSSLN